MDKDPLRCVELTPAHWPLLEGLFGAKGACGGCWCMAWRVARGGKLWAQTKGDPARRRFRQLVGAGTAHGILALDGDTPVGWCTFGPRAHFPRLERVRAYARPDASEVWSIPCFFVARGYRGRGLAHRLLAAAVAACARRGARIVEGYPVTATQDGKHLPAAFSWTGPLPVFLAAGFEVVQQKAASRPLVRRRLAGQAARDA